MGLPVAFILLLIADPATAEDRPPAASKDKAASGTAERAVTFTLDLARRVYDINVAMAYTTTVFFPEHVTCSSVSVGDDEMFMAVVNPKQKNRVVVTPLVEQLGSTTNVTVDCDHGVRVVLNLTQTATDKALQMVEFVTNPEAVAQVEAAVKAERERADVACAGRLKELEETARRDADERLLRAFLRRFQAEDDRESARQDFVIVHVLRQIVIGARGYILFEVQNRTDNEVVVKTVEVQLEETRQVVDEPTLALSATRVQPDTTITGAVAFDFPEAAGPFVLVVHEDGPRVIEITDIDF